MEAQDPVQLFAQAMAVRFSEALAAELEASRGPLVVTIPEAAKLLRKREADVRDAIAAHGIPVWGGKALIEDLKRLHRIMADEERGQRHPERRLSR